MLQIVNPVKDEICIITVGADIDMNEDYKSECILVIVLTQHR